MEEVAGRGGPAVGAGVEVDAAEGSAVDCVGDPVGGIAAVVGDGAPASGVGRAHECEKMLS